MWPRIKPHASEDTMKSTNDNNAKGSLILSGMGGMSLNGAKAGEVCEMKAC